MYIAAKGKSISNVVLPPTITLDEILKTIADEYGLTTQQLISRGRTKDLIEPRHIFCYISYYHTRNSLQSIGEWIQRDHTTAINNYRRLQEWIDTEEETRQKVLAMVQKIAMVHEGKTTELEY